MGGGGGVRKPLLSPDFRMNQYGWIKRWRGYVWVFLCVMLATFKLGWISKAGIFILDNYEGSYEFFWKLSPILNIL